MKSALSFLMAARRSEIAGLQRLSLTSELVGAIGRLVHALQRERGLSNLYLGSQGQQWAAERAAQVALSQGLQAEVERAFDQLDTDAARSGHRARLFGRIAYALQGLSALPRLRERVASRQWSTDRTVAAYARLIQALLAVVFEAADSATDPEVSRRLVAQFNFMQGKEFAGQERALGAALFARGQADGAEQQRLLHLIESQERCLEVFSAFAPPETRAMLTAPHASSTLAELERLRRVLCTAAHGAALKPELSQTWFDTCSARIDGMKGVEDRLTADLRTLCSEKIAHAQAELATFGALAAQPAPDPLVFYLAPTDPNPAPAAPQGFGLPLERSVLELVHDQARRLQAMGDELEAVRASLNERRLIERAKGLLMAHRQLSEADAHKALRQMAMNQNRRLVDVAEAVLAMAEVLPPR